MESVEQPRSAATEMWGKFTALGGPQHILDGAAPAIGFLTGYGVWNAKIGVLIALAVALGIGGYRLARGDSVKVVAISVALVVVFSLFVGFTGEGRAFYLPDLLICAVCTVAFGLTLLLPRRPLSHWISRRIGLEPADATDPAARLRLHRRVTLAWFVFWAVHLAVMVPLYAANKVVLLGSVALVLGKPALVVMLAVTWLWIRRSLRHSTPAAASAP
ncbi:DUF3159 domain-containing protein [Nocardia uniformis]|uniref:DUF3159 domain-containing protein n=1 Tax=Nocardia uniformis TaxID=53432 RepID=A0A849C0D2_9NOCA|nr:DUF3159 domain-containing protein [Nocardia uniformis]NNH70906.1 DUF3159 domain-containing protein [Nocardia uniformis]